MPTRSRQTRLERVSPGNSVLLLVDQQEGLLGRCKDCDGSGLRDGHWTDSEYSLGLADCPKCQGEGWVRLYRDVHVIQLGDLAHVGGSTGSETGDILCYKYVTKNRWVDVVLWGNHDRALVDPQHEFRGYRYNPSLLHYITQLHEEGRLMMVIDAHGFLISHAGLADHFKQQKVDEKYKTDLEAFVDWINDKDEEYLIGQMDPRTPHVDKDKVDWQAIGVINAIGHRRGGASPVGGLLWRDIEESLYSGFRQIFGHSADNKEGKVRYCDRTTNTRKADVAPENPSYCIDVGGKRGDGHHALAGIWLPSEKIVRVDLD